MSILPDDHVVLLPVPLPMYLVRAVLEGAIVRGETVTDLLTRAVRRDLGEAGVDLEAYRSPSPQEAWGRLIQLTATRPGRDAGIRWMPDPVFAHVLSIYAGGVIPLVIWSQMSPAQRAMTPQSARPVEEGLPREGPRLTEPIAMSSEPGDMRGAFPAHKPAAKTKRRDKYWKNPLATHE